MTSAQWLEAAIERAGAIAGSIHRHADALLVLDAAVGLPPSVLEAVRTVPSGKGMAGLAWERGCPVQTCNLQTDATGDVRPGARAVDARAAVALPIYDGAGALRAVVGFAFVDERTLDPETLEALSQLASTLP